MANKYTEVTLEMRKVDGPSPERDQLFAGNGGHVIPDVFRVQVKEDGTIKRGTLLVMTSEEIEVQPAEGGNPAVTETINYFVPCTKALLVPGKVFAIAADTVTLTTTQYTMLAMYFGGEFNNDRVTLPEGVTPGDAKPVLINSRIFLRSRVLLEDKDIKFM